MTGEKIRITAQVLNGATGEVREVVANVVAGNEQEAVDTLFARARRDDYYFRFLGHAGVIAPSAGVKVVYQSQVYWSKEEEVPHARDAAVSAKAL